MLLHGLTATRRYVVMGSKALERGGHRVIAYDARGHGQSRPAGAVRLRGAGATTWTPCWATAASSGAVLAGASMGAHTIVRFALDHPQRVAPLVLITPAFDPEDDAERPRPLGRPCRGAARGRRRRLRRGVRQAARARALAGHGRARHPPADARARAPRRDRRRARAGPALAPVRGLGRPARSRSAGHGRGAAETRPIPSIPYASGRALRRPIPGARLVSEEPGSPRSPGRAASSRASSPRRRHARADRGARGGRGRLRRELARRRGTGGVRRVL